MKGISRTEREESYSKDTPVSMDMALLLIVSHVSQCEVWSNFLFLAEVCLNGMHLLKIATCVYPFIGEYRYDPYWCKNWPSRQKTDTSACQICVPIEQLPECSRI